MTRSGSIWRRRDFLGALAAAGVSPLARHAARGDEPAAAAPSFAFGVVADAQYADVPPAGSRHYRASLEKLAACVDYFNGVQPAFVVHLGDLIDRHFNSFDKIVPIFDRLTVPHYHLLGNHDFAVIGEHKGKVPDALHMPARWYDFVQGDWRFIVLDGNDVGYVANTLDPTKPTTRADNAIDADRFAAAEAMRGRLQQAKRPNAAPYNGGIGPAQMAWLRQRLEMAAEAEQRVILLCHFPVVPEPYVSNLWNDLELIELIAATPCVAAYFNGHHHPGNYAVRDGVHYVTVEGMVETADTTAYGLVEVYADRLQLTGVGRVPSRTMTLGERS